MLTNQFKISLAAAGVAIVAGGLAINQIKLDQRVNLLEYQAETRALAVPTPTVASPSATLTPASPVRYYWPVKPTLKK